MTTRPTRLLKRVLKGAFVFLGLAAAIALLRLSGLHDALDTAWVDANIRDHGFSGLALYLGVGCLLTAVGMPRQVVGFLGGYAFGAALGTVWGTLATAMGCVVTFYYARLAGQSFVARRFSRRVAKINAFLGRDPFTMSFIIRCLPVGNNMLTNLLAGVSAIPALPFFAGSAAGYVPQTFIFALLGSGVRVSPELRTTASAVLFVVSSLLGYLLYRRYRVDDTLEAPEEEPEDGDGNGAGDAGNGSATPASTKGE